MYPMYVILWSKTETQGPKERYETLRRPTSAHVHPLLRRAYEALYGRFLMQIWLQVGYYGVLYTTQVPLIGAWEPWFIVGKR